MIGSFGPDSGVWASINTYTRELELWNRQSGTNRARSYNSDNEMAHYVLPLPSMANSSKPEVITQVEKIRSEIREFGESRVGCEELSLLCSDVSAMQEKIGIEQIAEYEGWSFQYLPDGHVRFAPSATALRTRPRT